MEEQKKQATRIQTSILSSAERKALTWLAARQPRWVTSDMLTWFGTFGALLVGLGFALAWIDYRWIWLSTVGLVIHWYGDSLDGSLARYRNTQRPTYGYYIDHTMDVVTEGLMFIGFGLSPYARFDLSMVVFVLYLALTLNVSINAHLKSEFKLTYAKLGPTEFRLFLIIFNTILIFVKPFRELEVHFDVLKRSGSLHCLDVFGLLVIAVLTLMYVFTVISDARGYAKIDPPKKF